MTWSLEPATSARNFSALARDISQEGGLSGWLISDSQQLPARSYVTGSKYGSVFNSEIVYGGYIRMPDEDARLGVHAKGLWFGSWTIGVPFL